MAKSKILLAEQSEIFREGLVKLLEHEPSLEIVCTCRTGLEAVEAANEHKPDVILIDTALSECSGIEAIQRIHEKLPKTAIIVLTCSKLSEDFFSAIQVGAAGYICKDNTSIDNLVKAVALAASGEVIVSPPMASRLLTEFGLLQEYKDAAKSIDVNTLTKREQAVLSLVAQGLTNKEIAATLSISENTVKVHLRNTMEKLQAHTRQQAVVLGRELANMHSLSLGRR